MSFRITPASKYASRHPKRAVRDSSSDLLSTEDYDLFDMTGDAVPQVAKKEAPKKGHCIRPTNSACADFY